MYTLKIKITKEILRESANCGMMFGKGSQAESCAFAVAVREIFPRAVVCYSAIYPFGGVKHFNNTINVTGATEIPISAEMTAFIFEFDANSPYDRVQMKEQEFELEIPDNIIQAIDIQEVTKILADVPHLELIEA